MATVYLAEDLKHGRKVAIKVLHPELSAVIGSERFLREIRTTAQLQHPHILGLIDSGEADGLLYYVMPFVEGESLRGRLSRERQLPVDDALRLTKEVASALEFAHKRGIVHRDIKPENILLQDGQALVADFGIALAVATPDDDRVTTMGMSIGSPVYMSPEQATAEREIDRRSDVYSLGVVLYEMLVGEPPYGGPTTHAITARKLSLPVPSVRKVREGVPELVERAVARALAKAPADRFRSCAEFTAALDVAHGEPATGTANRAWTRWVFLGVGGAVVAAGAALLTLRQPPPATVQIGKRSAVVATADPERFPAISPDGRLVAFTTAKPGRWQLFVHQVEGGRPIQVASELTSAGFGAFSPDGDRLLVLGPGGLYIVPTLGGQTRLVVPNPGNTWETLWGTWSPDGSRIAYVQRDTLFTQPIDSARTALAHGRQLHSPAWSPDGRWIVYVSGNSQFLAGNVAPSALQLVPASGGPSRVLTDSLALNNSPVWLPGARALLFISNRDGGRDVYQLNLRRSGAPDQAPERITTGLDPEGISLSADGSRLVWSVIQRTANIWSLPLPARGSLPESSARAETSGRQQIENLSASPDGRWLVYDSDRSGNQDLWRLPLAGGPPERITEDPADDFQPAVSPDGEEVAFHSLRTGNRDIFVGPLGGGAATRISSNVAEDADVAWSPDGQALVWETYGKERAAWIARRDATGKWSTPERLPLGAANSLAWSPDGRWISYSDSVGTWLWSPTTGERRRLASDLYMQFYEWAEDSRSLLGAALRGGKWETIRLALDGSVQLLVHRDSASARLLVGFTARGGRMYFTRPQTEADIWVGDVVFQKP